MLSDMFADLIKAKTAKERETAFRSLEAVGVDRLTAITVVKEMTKGRSYDNQKNERKRGS